MYSDVPPITYYWTVSRKKEMRICTMYSDVPPIAYYFTVSLILDHSYLVGKLTSSKIADTKVSGF
jgi:hypothetical protein